MKKLLALCLCVSVVNAPAAPPWTIININTNTITTYFNLATNINGNNDNFTGWLNTDDQTNAYFQTQVNALWPAVTNSVTEVDTASNALAAGLTFYQVVVTNASAITGPHGWTNFYSQGILTNCAPW